MKFVLNAFGYLQNLNTLLGFDEKSFCPNSGCQKLSYTSEFQNIYMLHFVGKNTLTTKFSVENCTKAYI